MSEKQIRTARLKAYSYLRFSTPKQMLGDSHRRQIEGARAWCEENNVELVDQMQELGVSAFRGKHRMLGILGQFLSLVMAGEIPEGTILIVEDMDRLSREKVLEALKLYTDLIMAGITIVTLVDKQSHSRETIENNPMVLQMAIAAMTRANGESERKSYLIKSRWAESRRLALEGKPSPMGRPPCWLERDSKTREIVKVEDKSETVKMLFEKYASGMTPREIQNDLNNAKRRPLTNRNDEGLWQESAITPLLRSKSAIGTLIVREPYHEEIVDKKGRKKKVRKYRKIAEVENYYPAIISKQLFAKVQTILAKNYTVKKRSDGRGRGNRKSPKNAFSGIAIQMGTGQPVSYRSHGKYEYLNSKRAYALGIGRLAPSWYYADFQDLFVATCRLAMKTSGQTTEAEAELSLVMADLAEVKGGISSLYSLAKKASNAKAGLLAEIEKDEERKMELEEKADMLRQKIRQAKTKSEAIPTGITDRVELRRILRANVAKLEIDFDQRHFKCELFSGITYEARIDENNHCAVLSDDFTVPSDALEGVKIRQNWKNKMGAEKLAQPVKAA